MSERLTEILVSSFTKIFIPGIKVTIPLTLLSFMLGCAIALFLALVRVAIARAIAYNPEVVLFDEPTSALDPRLTGEVLDVMRKLAEEGTTMVVVTHEMEFARKAANWVVYMEDGVIVEEGPSKEFFACPKNENTRKFLHLTGSDLD